MKKTKEQNEDGQLEKRVAILEERLDYQEDIIASTRAMMYKAILKSGKEYIVKTETYFNNVNFMKIKIIDIDNDIITYIHKSDTINPELETIVNLKTFINTYTILKEINNV